MYFKVWINHKRLYNAKVVLSKRIKLNSYINVAIFL